MIDDQLLKILVCPVCKEMVIFDGKQISIEEPEAVTLATSLYFIGERGPLKGT